MKELNKIDFLKYAQISRRSFLKGAIAVGSALALAGCQQNEPTEQQTTAANTSAATSTVAESAPTVPENEADVPTMINASFAYILPEYVQCVGCNKCMLACSFYHCGDVDMSQSNIQVYAINIKGGMVDIPILCMKCSDAPCQSVCPDKVAAISRDEKTGAMKIDHDKCTLCGLCIDACSEQRTGCLHLNKDEDKVVGMCDHCDGNPACVTACPEDILQIITGGSAHENRVMAQKPDVIALQVWSLLYQV